MSHDNLAGAVLEFARETHELHLELRRGNNNQIVLFKMIEMELKIMTALETLTDAVNQAATAQADLTTAVNAAIVRIGTPGATDAQLLTIATAVQANTDSDNSLTSALNAVLSGPPVPPT